MIRLSKERILVTGAAGFIGAFLCRALLGKYPGVEIIGVDNLNDYYDPALKHSRLDMLRPCSGFEFIRADLTDKAELERIFGEYRPGLAVNLAAQAGVRYSVKNPDAYISSNISGFMNLLECCRIYPVKHLVYASSSSVYGNGSGSPFSTQDRTDSPLSLYAATKKANELMAHAYSSLHGIPSTGLRFFSVYGPMGRPDMAYFRFADMLTRGNRLPLYNYGDLYRDFTYIDDIVAAVMKVMERAPDENADGVRCRLYNIGGGSPRRLMDFVSILENCLADEGLIDGPGEKMLLPMQPGDVYRTCADTRELEEDFGLHPETPLETGLREFARWYRGYHELRRERGDGEK